MNLMERMVEQARANKQRIVLPEGTEERTLQAADEYWPTTSPILYSSGNRLKLWNLPIGTS